MGSRHDDCVEEEVNRIIFPFHINDDNRETYVKSIDRAMQEGMELILFTTLPNEVDQQQIDAIYLHLLDLHGYYNTKKNAWSEKVPVKITRAIQYGDPWRQLREIVNEKKPCRIVCQTPAHRYNAQAITKALSNEIYDLTLLLE